MNYANWNRASLFVAFSAALFVAEGVAHAQGEPTPPAGAGGPGESCRARTDCAAGLKCMNNVCHDEMEGASCTSRTDCGGKLQCVSEKCVVPGTTPANGNGSGNGGGNGSGNGGGNGSGNGGSNGSGNGGGSSGDSGKKWKGFEGLRGFGGLTIGGGPTFASSSLGSTTQGGFLFALKGGILIDRWEVGLEFSPVTFLPVASVSGAKPTLQLNVYGGYHIPLVGPLSWPLRLGVGLMAVNMPDDKPMFQMRADAIGLSALVGPVLLDLHAPSFRFFANDLGYSMHFMFGIGGSILPDAFF